MSEADPQQATVHIVDDDEDVCASVKFLVESIGLDACSYQSAADFFDRYSESGTGCLILDLRMPGISGLEAMEKLVEHGIEIPVIVVTGHGDVPAAVRALKMGAFDFLDLGSFSLGSAFQEKGRCLRLLPYSLPQFS